MLLGLEQTRTLVFLPRSKAWSKASENSEERSYLGDEIKGEYSKSDWTSGSMTRDNLRFMCWALSLNR